jgi:hypothetical protein
VSRAAGEELASLRRQVCVRGAWPLAALMRGHWGEEGGGRALGLRDPQQAVSPAGLAVPLGVEVNWPLLEFWFIPEIKSPSRLAICYRSRLDDVAAGPLHHRNPIKRNPCEVAKLAQVGKSSRSCTSCLPSTSGSFLQHMFQDFKLLMLSKFVIASRCSRLVVIVPCLVSANSQQFHGGAFLKVEVDWFL